MKTQADNTQESQNSITPRVTSEPSDGGTAQLMDNRTSSMDQRKLRSGMDSSSTKPIQRKNNTGLPDNLKSGIENLSGYSMDDVKVHYNSSKPAQLQAHAYAQGTDIHLASGQEKHLPHEAWHVVQQKQGRVKPTRQLKSKVNINDDEGLEREADVMGERALRGNSVARSLRASGALSNDGSSPSQSGIMQAKKDAGSRLSGEQTIQAHGWVRNTVTGKTLPHEEGAALGANEEFLEDRFMASGEGFEYGPNYQIDPDTVGGPNGVVDIPLNLRRPDDVSRHSDYRTAIHKLQDLYFFVDEEQEDKDKGKLINKRLIKHQDKAKKYAKDFKKDKRNLAKDNQHDDADTIYSNKMDLLVIEVNRSFNEFSLGSRMGDGDLPASKTTWRERWRKILDIVEGVLKVKWPIWRNVLQEQMVKKSSRKELVRNENWELSFGGSLGKGYKGPPKQNVRFLTTRFDVDANMNADALANYLIFNKKRKVDRGTIKVENGDSETKVKKMDQDMDRGIKTKLVEEELATNGSVEDMVSEPFETLVNARRNGLASNAVGEWIRSDREQRLRDRITRLNGGFDNVSRNRFLNNLRNSRSKKIRKLILEEDNRVVLNTDKTLTVADMDELDLIIQDSDGGLEYAYSTGCCGLGSKFNR